MKACSQRILTVTAAMLLLALTSGLQAAEPPTTPAVGWFRRTFLTLSWDEIATVVRTPKDISRRVRTQVTYVKDRLDRKQAAERTWTSARGDCEDFAELVVALARKRGLEAWIHVFYREGRRDGHAVAMGVYKGKLWMSSNGWYQTVKDMKDAQREIAREMGWDRRAVQSDNWANLKEKSRDVDTAARRSAIIR